MPQTAGSTDKKTKSQVPKGMNDFGIKSDDEIAAERKFIQTKPGKKYINTQWDAFKAQRKGKTKKAAKFLKKLSKY